MAEKDITRKLSSLDEQAAKLEIEKNLALEKAFRSDDPDTIYKAQQYWANRKAEIQSTNLKGKGLVVDPLTTAAALGYYDKRANLSFPVLQKMSRAPIIRAVIDTRKEQVSEFCRPQDDKYAKGFEIRKKKEIGNSDKEEKISKQEEREMGQLKDFLLNGGEADDVWDLDDFETIMRKIVEDSLTLDQACAEVVTTRSTEPKQFYHLDGSMIRLADSYDNMNNVQQTQKIKGYYPSYVQIYDNNIIAEFYPWELMFGVRNPQTSIYSNGYGRSELEDLIQTVTALLNSDNYNSTFFRNGSAPKGALIVKGGGLNKAKIQEFKNEWRAEMVGPNNMHSTPILDAEKMEWLDLQKTNRDMEFSRYQEYLIKLICALYKISPEEIGFPIQGMNRNTIGGGGQKQEEKDYSMTKGLHPLLRMIEKWINKWIIGPKSNNKYEFAFVGVNVESPEEEEERLNTAVEKYMTVNEVRKAHNLPDIEGGDIVLNPVMAQQAQMAMMGDPQSDMFMDEQFGGEDDPQEDENPFLKSYNKFLTEELELDLQKG